MRRRLAEVTSGGVVLLALLLGASALHAQETPGDTTRARPEVRRSEPIDTLAFGAAPADTIPLLARRFEESEGPELLATIPTEDRLPRNPRNAAIRAFLVPGWGQVYTGHPLRGVVFAVSEVGFFLLGRQKHQDVLDLRAEIDVAREAFFADTTLELPEDPDIREGLFRQSQEAIQLFNDLEFNEDRRADFYAYAAASVIFAAVDAYVAAQLDPIQVGADLARRRAWVALEIPIGPRAARR